MTKRVMNTERSREPVAGENRCKYAFMKITFELQGRNQDSLGCDVFFALGRTVLTANMAGRMCKQVVNELIRSLVLFTKGGAFYRTPAQKKMSFIRPAGGGASYK